MVQVVKSAGDGASSGSEAITTVDPERIDLATHCACEIEALLLLLPYCDDLDDVVDDLARRSVLRRIKDLNSIAMSALGEPTYETAELAYRLRGCREASHA